MKIVFTGGGTGGHFYPIIAVAEQINVVAKEHNLLKPELYFISSRPYDTKVLFENEIEFRQAPAGKLRRYLSILNFFDLFKTGWGIIQAIFQLYSIYPDVVFSKGGYASFPTVVAARFLKIPVFIHESDAVPGRVNKWAGKFAYRIAVSYPETAEYFKKQDAVLTGVPVRKEIARPAVEGSFDFLGLDSNIPTILVWGGSQGSQKINEVLLEALPEILEKYQVIHQTGQENYEVIKQTTGVILENSMYASRYKAFDYLNDLAIKMSAGASTIIVSRAGSTSIFEISMWEKPSIIIPIPEKVSHDQRRNAYAYARTGAAVVLEEKNLTPHLLISEATRIIEDEAIQKKMIEGAKSFKKPDAARVLAEEIISVALEHEK